MKGVFMVPTGCVCNHIVCSYTVLLGFLFAVYSLSGTDAAVHIAEETKSADRGAPRSLIFSYCANATYGLAFVLAILFSMQARCSSSVCQAVLLSTQCL